MRTISKAVNAEGKMGFWGTTAISLAKSRRWIWLMFAPLARICPLLGAIPRHSDLMMVDLPEPLGPTSPTISPGRVLNDTPCTTSLVP